ncbi:uncharacterized protein C7orf57 homolog isoform X1 [Lampetra planeri]
MMPAERSQNAAGRSELSLGAIGGIDDPEAGAQDLGVVRHRRGPIGEPESDYVKLARQGGQRDLLKMPDNSGEADPSVPYNRPGWLNHNPPTRSGQETSVTARAMGIPAQENLNWSDIKAKYMTREAPFATDPVSLRQQTPGADKLTTHGVGSANERSGSISSIPENTVSTTHAFEGKPPPLKSNAMPRRQREETNMWTLMSFGYTGDSAPHQSVAKESEALSSQGGNTERPWATDPASPKGAEQAKGDDDLKRNDLVKRYGSRSAGPTF